MRKRFVIKKKLKEVNPILQIMSSQMKKLAAIENKIKQEAVVKVFDNCSLILLKT